MQVMLGKEKGDGTIPCSLCGTVQEGETVKEAISRLVIAHYGKMPKNTYWDEKYTRLGPHDNPTVTCQHCGLTTSRTERSSWPGLGGTKRNGPGLSSNE